MSTENNKKLVLEACKYLNDKNLKSLFALIDDNEGSWSIPFRSDKFAYGGFKNKAAFTEVLTGFLGTFSEFEFIPKSVTAEEDRVIVEADSTGVGTGGAKYKNNYLMIFHMKNDKIHTVREYFDAFAVLDYVAQMQSTTNAA